MARPSNDPRQASLLLDAGDANGPTAGSLNFDLEFRAALSDAITGSGKSRDEIAAEMERLIGSDPEYPISRAMLDAWTAPSRSAWRFPAIYLPAFIIVTGAHWLLDRIARKCGRIVVSGEHAAYVEIARIRAEKARLTMRERELEKLTRMQRGMR